MVLAMRLYPIFYFLSGLLVGTGIFLDVGLIVWGIVLGGATVSLDILERVCPKLFKK